MATAKQQRTEESDWFEGQETTTTDLPRYGLGDPKDSTDKVKVLGMVEGIYESTFSQKIKGQNRLLHQVRPREPIDGNEKIILWGSYSIDNALPTLPFGTKFRITYQGMERRGGGKSQKMFDIQIPSNVRRVAHDFDTSSASDEIPF